MRKYAYDTWSDSLRKATQLEYIRRNPMDCVEPVKHVRSIGKALTVRQQADYLERIRGHKLEKLFRFYLLTGCWASEALPLRPPTSISKTTCFISAAPKRSTPIAISRCSRKLRNSSPG